jgi:hypothetical protein
MLLSRVFESQNPFTPGASAIDMAKSSAALITLKRNEATILNLSTLGVPENARILSVFLTPNSTESNEGFLYPGIVLQSIKRGPIPRDHLLHPIPFFGGEDIANIAVLCSWMDPAADPELSPLATALEAYDAGADQEVIVPAAVAVEFKLGSVLRDYYLRFAGRKKVETFLQDAATFSHQLSPILPSVMSAVNAPPLGELIAGKLNWLRSKRNQVAHNHASVSRHEATDAVLAAIFGYRYLSIYGPLLK